MDKVYFTEYDGLNPVFSQSCQTGGVFGGRLTFELRPAVTTLTPSPIPAMIVSVCGLSRFIAAWRNGEDQPWEGLDDLPEHVRRVVETWPWPWMVVSRAVLLKTLYDVIVEHDDIALTRHYSIVDNCERGEAICVSQKWTGPEVLVAVSKIIDGTAAWERVDHLPHCAQDFEADVVTFIREEEPRSW